ncbi:cyclase family protein [soil metagenome]
MAIRPGDGASVGLDRIGPNELLGALAGVREGRVLELSTTFGRDMPQGSPDSFYGFRLTQYRTPKALTSKSAPAFDFAMEVIAASPHVGTHIDGLAHISCYGRLFGDHELADVYTDFGWLVNGMEHSRAVVGRGILLDVARAKDVTHLPDGYEITPDDMAATLAAQGTQIRPGDSVLVRTGWLKAWYASAPETYFASQPGVGPDAALWLYDQGMALLGTDTSGTEVIPMPDPERTTHGVLLVERGVHVIEIMDLESVADEEVYEFLFLCLPLRITGATGSWLRPVAVV